MQQPTAEAIEIANVDKVAHVAPSPRHSASVRQDQQPFPFFKLPAELRNKIYNFALTGYDIRLRITGKAYLSGPKDHTGLTFPISTH